MSIFSGPEIVNNGLVLNLDAANSRSYPGSGNNWYDLSGKGNHGTLVPRVTGYTFDGSSFLFPSSATPYQYAYVTSPIPTGAYSWTVEVVAKSDNISGERHIFRTSGNFGCDINTNRLRYYMTEYNVETALTPVNTFFANEWFCLAMTYDRTAQTQSVYKNGALLASNTHTVQYNITAGTNLWFSRSDTYQDGLGGNGAIIKFYNRVLTLAEIKQNYEAIRGRFGI